ncbi:hypothetical protein C8R42DRAFT_718667 [Lentinula raphanica]|nr:hypothetical protein C8R42DRAFT_718667 [Lentinula raphanica]
MIPSTVSRALLSASFLGAAISSLNVLAAPTPISPLSMSSNPASTGVQPAQPSSESAFGQESLSSRGPLEVVVPMVQRRELGHDVESTVPSQLEYGDVLGAVEASERDQDGTEDVKDFNASVSFVNLKHRGGYLSMPANQHEDTVQIQIKELKAWVNAVESQFRYWIVNDAMNLKQIFGKTSDREFVLKSFNKKQVLAKAKTAQKFDPKLPSDITEMAKSNIDQLMNNKEDVESKRVVDEYKSELYDPAKQKKDRDEAIAKISSNNVNFRLNVAEKIKDVNSFKSSTGKMQDEDTLENLKATLETVQSALTYDVPEQMLETAMDNLIKAYNFVVSVVSKSPKQ